ncbi:MAG: hypothetical protein ABW039_10175 [Sphingobium sp.]
MVRWPPEAVDALGVAGAGSGVRVAIGVETGSAVGTTTGAAGTGVTTIAGFAIVAGSLR